MKKNKKSTKSTKSIAVTEKMLGDYLHREREETRVSLHNRKRDADYFDGMTPSNDYMSQEFGYNEHENVKINTIRRNVDWAAGYIKGLKLNSRVVPQSNNEMARKYSEYRNWQLTSQWEACKAQRQVDKALEDALITGEGFLRIKTEMVLKNRVRAVVEHKSWKNIFYDRMNMDLNKARYLFHLSFQSPERLIERYPKHKTKIMEYKTYILNDRGIDQSEAHEFRTSDINPNEEHIAFGEAWWREYDENHPDGKVVYAPIIADEALNKVHLLEPPRSPYTFNKFPFVSIVADRYKRDGYPYSPLVRHSIGIEKVKQYALRSVIEAASRSGAVIDSRAFPDDPDISHDQFAQSVADQLSRPKGLAVVNNLEGVLMRDNHNEMNNMITLFKMLLESSSVNGIQMDPALLGSTTNLTAAVAMQEKARHADLSLTKPIESYQSAIEDLGEMMLAMIAQSEMLMEFPAFINDDGEINNMDMTEIEQFGADNKRAIEGFRFAYRVVADQSKTGYEQELLKMITEMAKVAPDLAPGLLLAADRIVPMGKGIFEAMATMVQETGRPMPTNLLPEKLRKRGEEMQQKVQEQEQQKAEMEKQGFMAEIDKMDSETAKLDTEAELNQAKTQLTLKEAEMLPLQTLADLQDKNDDDDEGGGGSPLDDLS